jgi:hypothetical protein
MAEGLTITNTLQRINLDVTKSWDDFDNTYEDRADLTVRLKSGEGDAAEPFRDMKVDLTKDNGWTGTFVGLPKYQNKQEVTYSVSEDPITGYTFTGSEAVYDTNNVLTGFVVSNKLDTISVTVNKVWDDNDNADQNRTDIKVSLLKKFADETSEDAWKAVEENVTVSKNASGQWTYTFNKLPKYQNQKALEYKVAEETVTGYVDPVVSKPAVDANGNYTFTITNKLATTSVKVTKVWDDDSNRDGIRPDIEVKLMADKHDGSGELQEVATCTLSAKDAVANEDGTTNNNTWSYTFDKLPIYHNGVKITYSVVESAIEDGSLEYYTPANEPESAEGVVSNEETDNVIDFTITNTHEVFRTFVTATKTWDDADDQDGKRPDEITLHLWKNKGIEGSEEEVDHATVTPDEDGNWTYTFDNLYKNEAGKEIAYTIEEEDVDLYDLDSNSVSKDADGNPVVALVNKHVPSVIDIDVEKVWNDGENQDGIRMDEVKVQLYADGAEVADQVLILNADNDWKGTFSGLDEYAKGQKIDYTVKEVVEDEWAELYTNEVTGTLADGYLITNTHVPYMTSVSVTKVWNDSDNLDGSRPDSVTVQLLANGEALEGKTLTLSETNGWADTFADLPEYANGEKIVYTVEEAAVEGYTTEITGSADEGFVITNSHEPVVEVVTTAQTGDSSNILLWMLSSIISGLTLVGAWIIRRRRLA